MPGLSSLVPYLWYAFSPDSCPLVYLPYAAGISGAPTSLPLRRLFCTVRRYHSGIIMLNINISLYICHGQIYITGRPQTTHCWLWGLQREITVPPDGALHVRCNGRDLSMHWTILGSVPGPCASVSESPASYGVAVMSLDITIMSSVDTNLAPVCIYMVHIRSV